MIILTLIFLLICLLQANYQARRFAKGKSISHPGKLWIYIVFTAGVTLLFMWGRWDTFVESYHYLYEVPIISFVTRLAWFDIILNAIRKRKWWYNGTRGTDKKGSAIDKIENKLSDSWVRVLKIGYCIIWFVVVIWL